MSIDSLLKVLSSDQLNVPTEERVYEAAMNWVGYDQAERNKHLPAIVEQVIKNLTQSIKALKAAEPVVAGYRVTTFTGGHLPPDARVFIETLWKPRGPSPLDDMDLRPLLTQSEERDPNRLWCVWPPQS